MPTTPDENDRLLAMVLDRLADDDLRGVLRHCLPDTRKKIIDLLSDDDYFVHKAYSLGLVED